MSMRQKFAKYKPDLIKDKPKHQQDPKDASNSPRPDVKNTKEIVESKGKAKVLPTD